MTEVKRQAYSAVSLEDVDSSSRPRGIIANAGADSGSDDDLGSLPQVVILLKSKHNRLRFSALSVEGPRRQGAVRIGQLDEAERRARTRPTTDRRYTADFPKNLQGLGLTLGLGDGKADTGPEVLGPAGIGGREDGSMGLFCLEDLTA